MIPVFERRVRKILDHWTKIISENGTITDAAEINIHSDLSKLVRAIRLRLHSVVKIYIIK